MKNQINLLFFITVVVCLVSCRASNCNCPMTEQEWENPPLRMEKKEEIMSQKEEKLALGKKIF